MLSDKAYVLMLNMKKSWYKFYVIAIHMLINIF